MNPTVGIIGATGLVGQEVIRLLLEEGYNANSLRLFASAVSAGKSFTIDGFDATWILEETTSNRFSNLDFIIFCTHASVAVQLVPEALKQGCVVIDSSSAFRLDPSVPLIIPEINRHELKGHQGIIASPNCTTTIALMGLAPLHQIFGLKRFFAVSYQAVSGSGKAGIEELESQVQDWSGGSDSKISVYPHPIAFNLIPQIDNPQPNGYTGEEMKLLYESRKILNLPTLRVSATCVRVPVLRAHSIAIHAEFENSISLERAYNALYDFPNLEVCDNPYEAQYPTPQSYSQKRACGIGRMRKDSGFENGLSFWIVGDQLWKGAALNCVQILNHLLAKTEVSIKSHTQSTMPS